MVSTQNHLSLSNRKPQTALGPVIKSHSGLKRKILSTVNSSRQSPDLPSKSTRLFNDGEANSNLSGDTQESRTTPSNLFKTKQSFPVSFSMTITVSPTQILQVFINFHGKELRHSFVSHLSNAFERHGIKFFIDKDEQRGKDLKNLFVRIEESKIGLAIFSTRYSTSKWCMNELVKMKKRADAGKLTLIPVFYKVKPSDLRKLTSESEFGKNFWRFVVEESDENDPIQEWRKALEGTTNKMGLTIGDKSSEADFIEDIVKAVQTIMQAIKEEKE